MYHQSIICVKKEKYFTFFIFPKLTLITIIFVRIYHWKSREKNISKKKKTYKTTKTRPLVNSDLTFTAFYLYKRINYYYITQASISMYTKGKIQ